MILYSPYLFPFQKKIYTLFSIYFYPVLFFFLESLMCSIYMVCVLTALYGRYDMVCYACVYDLEEGCLRYLVLLFLFFFLFSFSFCFLLCTGFFYTIAFVFSVPCMNELNFPLTISSPIWLWTRGYAKSHSFP